VDSGDDRYPTIGVGCHWTLILGPASALIDNGEERSRQEVLRETLRGRNGGAFLFRGDYTVCVGADRATRILVFIEKEVRP
jgi:hypothetical protein